MRIVVASLLLSLLMLGAPASATAQATSRVRPSTDWLVREALEKASLGDTASALDLLERATDQSPRNPEALYWRALMLSRTTALTIGDTPRRLLAGFLLNRANNIDPTNARYLIEMGRIRLKTPLLRVEAERLFRHALEVAETSSDPLHAFAGMLKPTAPENCMSASFTTSACATVLTSTPEVSLSGLSVVL